jgi:hypothetical protein
MSDFTIVFEEFHLLLLLIDQDGFYGRYVGIVLIMLLMEAHIGSKPEYLLSCRSL